MSSKFNCLNSHAAASKSKESKETKFQKYLRERNQKILEKCFNIKPIQSAPLVVVADTETTKATETEPVALAVADKATSIETESIPEAELVQTKETSNEKSKISKREKHSKRRQAEPNEFVGDFSIQTKSIKTKTIATKTITTKTLETKTKSLRNADETVDCDKLNQMRDKNKRFAKKSSPTPSTPPPPQRRASAGNIESTQVVYSVTRSVKVQKTKSTVWRSYAITTTSSRKRLTSKQQQYSPFDYDLSREEQKFARQFSTPMKPPAEAEMELLKKGQRKEYLTQRYEHSPVAKYNYPEATSWRIGWLQRQPQPPVARSATPTETGCGNKLK